MTASKSFARARGAWARRAGTEPPATLGRAVAVGALLVGVSDAVAPIWGHHVDWSSPTWWAWQAAISAAVGMSLGAIARDDSRETRRRMRAPATPASAWRLHRLAGRLTHEVSGDGMRPDRVGEGRTDDADARRAAYAAQLASPVTTRDAMDGEGPEALRLAYVILVLCRSLKVDAARVVALLAQSGSFAEAFETARETYETDKGIGDFLPFFRKSYLRHHAYWETAVLSVARDLRDLEAGELDPMLVGHLARSHRAVWLAVTGRTGEPYFECAGIEAHAREETRGGKPLVEPHVEDAVHGKACS